MRNNFQVELSLGGFKVIDNDLLIIFLMFRVNGFEFEAFESALIDCRGSKY